MGKLDLDFFETIIAYKSLTDETYLASIVDHIKPIFFKNKEIKAVFSIISDFYEKRSTCPSLTEIKAYLINDDLKNSFKNVVNLFNNFVEYAILPPRGTYVQSNACAGLLLNNGFIDFSKSLTKISLIIALTNLLDSSNETINLPY